ncbi:MAG TPA: zinc ABC transporter substrate-binding protein [Solirubrobacteraceae bacterium]|nr:zinc ABC transporter substrate-binding protein [Solirubrobacteraceae bacterium]
MKFRRAADISRPVTPPRRLGGGLALLCACVLLAGCGSVAPSAVAGRLQVVAAENFWGSIAAQLGGAHVHVRSIITNPDTDPHDYEPTPEDARAVAGAQMVIVNGIGYDEWAQHVLSASEASTRSVLDVGKLLRLKVGADPHQWYSPDSVQRVIGAISAEYERLDPRYRSYFEGQERHFETVDLARYHALVGQIRSSFAGTPVGYSESIFTPLGEYLHLRLMTPYSYAKAVSEGTEVSASDQQAVEAQARAGEIKVWVYNSQNATPSVQRINAIASAAHIPIVTITETLAPASDTFEQWQVLELERLIGALRTTSGR